MSNCTIMRCYWGWKEQAKVHDLAHPSSSFSKLQCMLHGTNSLWNTKYTENQGRNKGPKGCIANHIEVFNTLSMASSPQTAVKTTPSLTAMPIWHQQRACTLQSSALPSSTLEIYNAPVSRFYIATSHPTMQCPEIPPKGTDEVDQHA